MLAVVPPIVSAFELTVASQGMSKGILQSDGPQFIPRLTLKAKSFQLSGQWKNISTNSAKGEASIAAGWSGKAAGTDFGASIAHKWLTSASGSGNRTSWELAANVSHKWDKLALRGSAVFSPDDFGATGRSLYADGGPSIDLPWKLRASAAIGRRWRQRNRDYTTFNFGVSRPLGRLLTLDLRYYDTDKGRFGEAFDNRVVGSVRLAL